MPTEPSDTQVLASWINHVVAVWRRTGVPPAHRELLQADLERDLREALDSGATVAELTSTDPSDFARDLARAQGHHIHEHGQALVDNAARVVNWWSTPRRVGYGNLVSTALGGAVLGAVVAAYAVMPYWYVEALPELVAALLVDIAAAGVTLAFALGAVALRFGSTPGLRRLLVHSGAGMGLAGALSVPPTVLLARTAHYTDAAPVVLMEVGLVMGFCSLGLLVARRLSG